MFNMNTFFKVITNTPLFLKKLPQCLRLKFKGNRWDFEAPLTACSKQLSIFTEQSLQMFSTHHLTVKEPAP